ncbi:MAG: two-component system, OmpR family, response regulator [Verrucomicrobiota bacterium]
MKKILIMEDDKKLSLAWAIRLRAAGYDVSTCYDGVDGLLFAAAEKPDLILMDIWLRSENGFAVAEDLKGADLGGIPIIFTTASRKKGLWKQALETGGAGFLEKPVTSEKLLETIAGTLERAKSAKSEPDSQRDLAPKRILIVEDDTKIAGALAARLKAAGYDVLAANDGFEGIKQAVMGKPDLIVMDIWMPVGFGFSVAQRLQQLGLGAIPIIFVTASKLKGLRGTAEELGAAGYVEKPYKPQELLSAISSALDGTQRRTEKLPA